MSNDGRTGTVVTKGELNGSQQTLMIGDVYPDGFIVINEDGGGLVTEYDLEVAIDDRIQDGDEVVLVSRWMRKEDVKMI